MAQVRGEDGGLLELQQRALDPLQVGPRKTHALRGHSPGVR
jgi:hypothetical protein